MENGAFDSASNASRCVSNARGHLLLGRARARPSRRARRRRAKRACVNRGPGRERVPKWKEPRRGGLIAFYEPNERANGRTGDPPSSGVHRSARASSELVFICGRVMKDAPEKADCNFPSTTARTTAGEREGENVEH